MSRRNVTPSVHGFGLPARDDARDLVIKVKYGGTLKRFNACVNGSHFDHNLDALRSKIANAFKFSPNDEFVLSYTDDDGDIVMLDDDDDLRDAAINQKLNPLRIYVQLNSTSAGAKQQASDSRSPMSAMEEQLAQVKSAIDDALKFVPEQVPAVLAKLSHELRSKAASSASPLAEFLDRIAKLITPRSSAQPTSGLMDSSSVSHSDHLQHLKNLLINNRLSGSATVSGSHDMQSSKALGLKSVLAEETKSQVGQAPGYTSIENPSVLGSSGGKLIYPRKKRTDAQSKVKSHAQIRGKSVISSSVPPLPYMAHGLPTQERNMYMPFGSYGRSNGDLLSAAPPPSGPQHSPIPTLESNGKINDDLRSMHCPVSTVESNGKINGEHSVSSPPRGPVYGPSTTPGWNGKINGGSQTTFPPPPAYDHNPFKSSMHPYGFYQDTNALGSYGFASSTYGSIPQPTVHKWVECDGCGVAPIIGSRYKSIVKDDYDLCSVCFSLAGNEAEYTRMDKPMSVSERLRGFDKNSGLQLDCRFIKDLTVPDGTVMAPSTSFRKIWCMRNSGPTAWPFGTQLTWIGGDQFARQSSVKLEISQFGFPVGGETDVCVDFVAPAKPGRYISYWRLTSPDLQTFGQRVWVLIQVEPYPLPKTKITLETLRDFVHLRARTNTIGAVARIRHQLAYATHTFFNENDYLYIHTPIITTSDCEGAGEMFQVTALFSQAEKADKELKLNPAPLEADVEAAKLVVKEKANAVIQLKAAKASKQEITAAVSELTKAKENVLRLEERSKLKPGIPRKDDGTIAFETDFFRRQAFLTVSGQLQVETYACALGSVYTFGPTFRAENSHTSRHLAEFWMVEPEIAFANLHDDMNCAESYVQYLCKWLLKHCREDMEFMVKHVDKTAIERLELVSSTPFERISYTKAVEILEGTGKKFENKVEWGIDLASEHERYLTEVIFKKPVIVYNYPKGIKAFYMRLNEDQKTVAAMDVLVPKVGELIGGSQREERLDVLKQRILDADLPLEPYEWYLDLRRFGTVKHSGFGLGFERMILFATGLENIRDVIPFPRYPGRADL